MILPTQGSTAPGTAWKWLSSCVHHINVYGMPTWALNWSYSSKATTGHAVSLINITGSVSISFLPCPFACRANIGKVFQYPLLLLQVAFAVLEELNLLANVLNFFVY